MAGPGAGDFLHCGRRGQQAQEKQALLILWRPTSSLWSTRGHRLPPKPPLEKTGQPEGTPRTSPLVRGRTGGGWRSVRRGWRGRSAVGRRRTRGRKERALAHGHVRRCQVSQCGASGGAPPAPLPCQEEDDIVQSRPNLACRWRWGVLWRQGHNWCKEGKFRD
jgi:hypothetical protein